MERSNRSTPPKNGKLCRQFMPFHWNAPPQKTAPLTVYLGSVRSSFFPIGERSDLAHSSDMRVGCRDCGSRSRSPSLARSIATAVVVRQFAPVSWSQMPSTDCVIRCRHHENRRCCRRLLPVHVVFGPNLYPTLPSNCGVLDCLPMPAQQVAQPRYVEQNARCAIHTAA